MPIQTTYSFNVNVSTEGAQEQTNHTDGQNFQSKIHVKIYPKFLGWLLSWFGAASIYRGERETYYLSKEAKQSLYKQVKALFQLEDLPDRCPEKIIYQIFLDFVFNTHAEMRKSLKNKAAPQATDPTLQALNRVSSIPVARKNDLPWICKNVKPGSILIVNAQESYDLGSRIVTTAQRFAKPKGASPYHTRALHSMVCVAPGKFVEATPSKAGDQVRILDFNQQFLDLPWNSTCEYQVYEPKMDEMDPKMVDQWKNRFDQLIKTAHQYAVYNTSDQKKDNPFKSFLPERIVESKLKYAPKDALFSVLKRNTFGPKAKSRLFKEVLGRQIGFKDPLTRKGKRSFICSALTTWLLQGMQHQEIMRALSERLSDKGETLQIPELKAYPSEVLKPKPFIRNQDWNKKQLKKEQTQYKEQVKEYKRYQDQCDHIDKHNGKMISQWADHMAQKHGDLLDSIVECRLDARFTNPMMLQDWIHSRPDIFRLSARIIPELKL